MTRILTAVLAGMLATAPAFAAKDPCKGVKVKADAFGAMRMVDVGDLHLKKIGDSGWAMSLGFNAGGGYGGFVADSREVLPEGTVVVLLMADGATVEITTSAATGSNLVTIMGVSVSHYELPFSLTKESATLLTDQPITAFRVMKGSDVWYSGEVKKGDAAKFQEMGHCVVTT